jgi:hypothetical protein
MNFATGCVDCRYLELAIVRKAIPVNVPCDDAAMRNRVGVGVEFDRPLHFRCSAGKGLPAPAPAAAPPASPTTTPAASPPAASKQSHDQEKQDGTDGGVDDCTEHSRTEMNAHPRQQPTSDKSAQNRCHVRFAPPTSPQPGPRTIRPTSPDWTYSSCHLGVLTQTQPTCCCARGIYRYNNHCENWFPCHNLNLCTPLCSFQRARAAAQSSPKKRRRVVSSQGKSGPTPTISRPRVRSATSRASADSRAAAATRLGW